MYETCNKSYLQRNKLKEKKCKPICCSQINVHETNSLTLGIVLKIDEIYTRTDTI